MSVDPAGMAAASASDPQSLNRYIYVLNTPTVLNDPEGLLPPTGPCKLVADENEEEEPGSVEEDDGGCGGAPWWAGGGASTLVIDGGAPLPVGLFGGLYGAGGESALPCPGNDCTGVTAQANGEVYRNTYSRNLTLNCNGNAPPPGAPLTDYQCQWSHWSQQFVYDGSDIAYFGDAKWRYILSQAYRMSAGPVYGSAAATMLFVGATMGTVLAPELPAIAPAESPLPPGWSDAWEWRASSGGRNGMSWWDEAGGEWRWHAPDNYHSVSHWNYNPWNVWNDIWTNIPH